MVRICGAHALASLRPVAERHMQTTGTDITLRHIQGHVHTPPHTPPPSGLLTIQFLSFPLCEWTHEKRLLQIQRILM